MDVPGVCTYSPAMAGGCETFIASVIAAADQSRTRPPRDRARDLAHRLVRSWVPELQLLGRDRRGWIAPGYRRSRERDEQPTDDVSGFRPTLVAGGQDEEALRHLAAAAAAVLAGRTPLVWLASVVDWLQGWRRDRRRESRAEIAGNQTGAALGHLLQDYLNGVLTRGALEDRLAALLCGPSRASDSEA